MRIELLDEAQDDLIQGFHFYEDREAGLGTYFLDCLFSDIDSLLVYAGIHQVIYGHRRCLSKCFLLPSITVWREIMWFVCMPYWIAGGIRYGSGND